MLVLSSYTSQNEPRIIDFEGEIFIDDMKLIRMIKFWVKTYES